MIRNNRKLIFNVIMFSFFLFSLVFKATGLSVPMSKDARLSSNSNETPLRELTPLSAIPFEAPGLKNQTSSPHTDGILPHSLHWIECGGQKWLNYNHRRKNLYPSHLDFPISIIIYGHASVARVKNIFSGQRIASKKYQAYDIGKGPKWNSDTGAKRNVLFDGPDGPDMDSLHIRVFAPKTGYFEGSGGWGHYVIVSTHFDFNPPWDTLNGYSEDAERKVLHLFARNGYTVVPDFAFIHNSKKPVNKKEKYWQSNGYVSLIYLPPATK
jgi:hypothetical protein